MKKPAAYPVWWTVHKNFERMPTRSELLARCHKCQNWIDARAKLGGHPVRLDEICEGSILERCIRKLEGL